MGRYARGLLWAVALVLLWSQSTISIPTEWLAEFVEYYPCLPATGGNTNTASVNPGTVFAHNLSCTIQGTPSPHLRTNTTVEACATYTVATGSGPSSIRFGLRAGATTIVSGADVSGPQANSTVNFATCYITVVGGEPGASVPTTSSVLGSSSSVTFPADASSTAQPVNLATNTNLAWTAWSQWSTAGTGVNTATLSSFKVKILNNRQ